MKIGMKKKALLFALAVLRCKGLKINEKGKE